jgi:hypothetical protein
MLSNTSENIHTLPVRVAQSRKHGLLFESRCYPIYHRLRFTLLHLYFKFKAAMFDLPVTPMSESIQTILIVLLDPENVGLAVGASLLSCI